MIIVRYSSRMRSFGDDLQRFRGMRVGVEFGQVEQVCAHGENERREQKDKEWYDHFLRSSIAWHFRRSRIRDRYFPRATCFNYNSIHSCFYFLSFHELKDLWIELFLPSPYSSPFLRTWFTLHSLPSVSMRKIRWISLAKSSKNRRNSVESFWNPLPPAWRRSQGTRTNGGCAPRRWELSRSSGCVEQAESEQQSPR